MLKVKRITLMILIVSLIMSIIGHANTEAILPEDKIAQNLKAIIDASEDDIIPVYVWLHNINLREIDEKLSDLSIEDIDEYEMKRRQLLKEAYLKYNNEFLNDYNINNESKIIYIGNYSSTLILKISAEEILKIVTDDRVQEISHYENLPIKNPESEIEIPDSLLKLGDLNSDGMINSTDAVLMRRYILDVIDSADINIKNADVNRDGKVNSTDYILLRRYVLEIIKDLNTDYYRALKAGFEVLRVGNFTEVPEIQKINSNADLVEILGGIQQYYFGSQTFEEALEKYSDEFFENNDLIFVALQESVASISHRLQNITTYGDLNTINIYRYIPLIVTGDVGNWVAFITAPKDYFRQSSKFELKLIDQHEQARGHKIIRTQVPVKEYPYVERIKSTNELTNIFEGSLNEEAKEAIEKYTDEYFENNDLIFVALEEGSGSIRHKLERVVIEGNSLVVNIERFIPLMGTDDMAYRVLLIEVFTGNNEVYLNIINEHEVEWKHSKIITGGYLERPLYLQRVDSVSQLESIAGNFISINNYTDEFFETKGMIISMSQSMQNGDPYDVKSVAVKDDTLTIYTDSYVMSFPGPPAVVVQISIVTVDKDILDSVNNIKGHSTLVPFSER